ncbi:aldo/keto reductase, partial [Staphylococcus aureus]
MHKNILKRGISLSELGLGCMSLGTDLKKASQIIDCAVENGITYFDTADMYDKGIIESVVAKALLNYQ